MANNYVLTININDKVDNKSPIAGTDDQKKNKTAAVGGTILAAYAVTQPFISKTKSMILNQVQTDYANSELTERTRLAMEVGSKLVDVGVKAAAGASLASILGLGTGVGAVIGVVTSVAEKLMDYLGKVQQINNSQKIENEGIQVLRGRAGIQFNRSRSGQ